MHGTTERGRGSEAHRVLGMIRSELEFAPTVGAAQRRLPRDGTGAGRLLGGQRRGGAALLPAWRRDVLDGVVTMTAARTGHAHVRSYAYDQPVTRVVQRGPADAPATGLAAPLESEPARRAGDLEYRYVDYWGTQVRVFEALAPHRELVVEARSLVEVDARAAPAPPTRHMAWAQCAAPTSPTAFDEFLTQTAGHRAAGRTGRRSPSRSPRRRAGRHRPRICCAVHEAMTYQPGSTGVHTLAAEAWADRTRRVPGLRPSRRRRAAPRRPARALRLGLPAPRQGTARSASSPRREPRLGRVVARRVGRYDPTNDCRRRSTAHRGRRRTRLRRRARRSRASSPGPASRRRCRCPWIWFGWPDRLRFGPLLPHHVGPPCRLLLV